MPDDVGGGPFPDGEEPEYRDHGAADDEFASVVLDEDFVRAAEVHEPTAAERILASAQSHAESENPRALEDGVGYARGEGEFPHDELIEADEGFDDDPDDDEGRFDRSEYRVEYEGAYGFPPELDPAYEHGADFGYAYGAYGRHAPYRDGSRPYRGHRSWQRPFVAWVLAVVMGIGMVALAFSAVYRGTSNQRQQPTPPPATTGVERNGPAAPPTVSAQPPGG